MFVEKFGGAFIFGSYASNATTQIKDELLKALQKMASDAVAIVPEGCEVKIETVTNKSTNSSTYKDYIAACNAEMSKAVLGQTLTTEVGDVDSYAAAKTHNLVREDLVRKDRIMICTAFNKLAAVWCYYNYGEGVIPPTFQFVEDEDLQDERAERYTKLYNIGVRFKKSYISREFGVPEDDYDLQREAQSAQAGFARVPAPARASCTCGCVPRKKQSFFKRVLSALFAKKEDKRQSEDASLMAEFENEILADGQDSINSYIEAFADALGNVSNFDEAAACMDVYNKHNLQGFADSLYEARYAARGIRGSHE